MKFSLKKLLKKLQVRHSHYALRDEVSDASEDGDHNVIEMTHVNDDIIGKYEVSGIYKV